MSPTAKRAIKAILGKIMNILLFGKSGFIGQAIFNTLNPFYNIKTISSKYLDFDGKINQNKLNGLFDDIDVVINAVGVMSDDIGYMENIHHHTPKELACFAKQYGIKTWINISAMGADSKHRVAFLGSKGRGDTAILNLADDNFKVVIIRPSLVFGKDGTSTELFLKIAKLPIWILPNGGHFMIQPVHIDDVALSILKIIDKQYTKSGVINFANKPILLKDYLCILANNFYHKNPKIILSISTKFTKFILNIFYPIFNNPLFCADNLTLLEKSEMVDNGELIEILRREPIDVEKFHF